MSTLIENLRKGLEGGVDSAAASELLQEVGDLQTQRDQLEELLIMLVRTGLPWDEDGTPNENFPHFRERYQKVLHEAAGLLGLELRSAITRTEPRTM